MRKQLQLFEFTRPYKKYTPIAAGDNVVVLKSASSYAIRCRETRRTITKEQADSLIENSKVNGEINPHYLDINALDKGLLGKNFGLGC